MRSTAVIKVILAFTLLTSAVMAMGAFAGESRAAGLGPAQKGKVKVRVDCYSEPETVAVVNNTDGIVVLHSISSVHKPHTPEPVDVGTKLAPNEWAFFSAGRGAKDTGNFTLVADSFIFEDQAADTGEEGVRMTTSAGTVSVMCEKWEDTLNLGGGTDPDSTATQPAKSAPTQVPIPGALGPNGGGGMLETAFSLETLGLLIILVTACLCAGLTWLTSRRRMELPSRTWE